MDIVYGLHAVEEALKARGDAFEYVAIFRERRDSRLQRIVEAARSAGVPVRFMSRDEVTKLAKSPTHQGVAAIVKGKTYSDLENVLEHKKSDYLFLVVLDGVEDPHNLGALIRTADGAGVDGVVIPERRAVGVTSTVTKVSAGAAEHMKIARVTNINRALDDLKEQGIWIVGLDERAKQTYDELDYRMDCAIVLGAEGTGLHDLVRRKCDFLVSIPMSGSVPSLNVSVAGGVIMYEVARKRRASGMSAQHDVPARKRQKGLGS
jgi:23S rRNA (guanosine2251-2'-O)-methyltransferase